jgi:hypothetical protein
MLMIRLSMRIPVSARRIARLLTPGWIKPSKPTACKDSLTFTLSIISEKTCGLPELQTGKCSFAAQSAALLQ